MTAYPLDWALVDVETSGLRPFENRVLSIALLTIGADGRVTGQVSSLVKPAAILAPSTSTG